MDVPSRRIKCLIVEDEAIQQLYLKKLLSSHGECHEATEGKEAEALFEKALSAGDPYQLVCLDIHLPDMSGYDLLKKFRSLEKQKKITRAKRSRILMVTVSKEFTHITNAFALDADGYLVKPVDPQEFQQKLTDLGLISA